MTLDHTLAALAAKHQPDTLAQARDALRKHGLPVKHARALRDARLAQMATRARRIARNAQPISRRGADYWARAALARKLALPLAHRRLALTADAVLIAWSRAGLRGPEPTIAYGAPDARVMQRSYYAKASHRFPTTDTTIRLSVPMDWRSTVWRDGLAVIDGLMTVGARWIAPDLAAATWLEQGRGFSLRVVAGYIAFSDGSSYHALTADAARAGAARKSHALRPARQRPAPDPARADARLAARVARRPDAQVTVALARGLGACEPGIRAWCERAGLDYDAGVAPLAEVWRAYRADRRPEARAAILASLRA